MGGFAETLRALIAERGISQRVLAGQVPCDPALISRYANGIQEPSPRMAGLLDNALGAGGKLAERAGTATPGGHASIDDEISAIEFARKAAASDVGTATVERLEQAVDSLAVAYPGTAPGTLLRRVRAHLGYLATLLEARKTLAEHRRLLTVGGWLSLLAATAMIDLGQHDAANAHLGTAARARGRAPRARRMVPGDPRVAGPHQRQLPAGRRDIAGRAAHRAAGRQRVHPGHGTGGPGNGAPR
jgi:transcriptional regulator with XRE-family HTH domain